MPQPSNKLAIIMKNNPNSRISEAYRSLRFNIDFSASCIEVNTLAITSVNRGEGKTTTALNLAAAYALNGKRVILIDANLRNPSVHLAFGADNRVGLSSFLLNKSTANEIVRRSHIENLSFIASGPKPVNPSELLASAPMDDLLAEIKLHYDMIVIDTPSVLALTDAKIMAAKSDGVLLVVEHGKLKRDAAKKAKDELQLAKVNLLGVVWNKSKKQ